MLGVVPWRTRSTRVEAGALGLRRETGRESAGVAMTPRQPSVSAVDAGLSGSPQGFGLDALAAEIVACRSCERLVEWREHVRG